MNEELNREAHRRLDEFDKDSKNIIDKIVARAKEFSKYKTQVLFGILGGAVSIPLSLIIAEISFLSFAAISSPFLAIGTVAGIYLSRGKRQLAIEKKIDERFMILDGYVKEYKLAASTILEQINNLPPNTPPDIIDELWNTYRELNKAEKYIPMLPPVEIKILKNGDTKSMEERNE